MYSIADLIVFATLLLLCWPLLVRMAQLLILSGLDGLGKVDSRLNILPTYVLNATRHNFAVSLAITFGQNFQG